MGDWEDWLTTIFIVKIDNFIFISKYLLQDKICLANLTSDNSRLTCDLKIWNQKKNYFLSVTFLRLEEFHL